MVCTLVANQAGNDAFLPATAVKQTLTFNKQATSLTLITPTSIPLSGAYLLAKMNSTEGRALSSVKGISFASTTPSICTVTEYTEEDSRGPRVTIRPVANGNCSIVINYAGDGSFKPSSTSWNYLFSGLNIPTPGSNTPQTIDFPALVDRSLGRSQPLLAKATSGLQITYISLTPSICYLLYPSTGAVVQTSAGVPESAELTCTIRATQPGDSRFAPASPVDRSFKYSKAPMVLQVESAPSLAGVGPHAIITRVRLVDNVAMSGLTSLGHLLRAASLTPSICAIQSHGTWDRTGGIVNRTYVTGISAGTCSLKFDFDGTKDRAPATLTWNAALAMPVETATFVEASIGGKALPAMGNVISRSTLSNGLITMDLVVKAVDPKLAPTANGGLLPINVAPLRVTFPTTNICSMSLYQRINNFTLRVVLRANAEGLCSIQVNYPGENSWRRLPSALNFGVTLTK
jgi:hypothetical protein